MWIVAEVWTDGPAPGFGSIVAIGAAAFNGQEDGSTFLGMAAPVTNTYDPAKLVELGINRTDQMSRANAHTVMTAFYNWIEAQRPDPGTPIVIVGEDIASGWSFLSYYFALYNIPNPIMRPLDVGDLFAGVTRNLNASNYWKRWMTRGSKGDPRSRAVSIRSALIQMSEKTGLILPNYVPTKPSPPMVKSVAKDGVSLDNDPEPE